MPIVGRAHHCKLPEATRVMCVILECVWECDQCKQRWLAVLNWDGDKKQPGKFFRGGYFPGWEPFKGYVDEA